MVHFGLIGYIDGVYSNKELQITAARGADFMDAVELAFEEFGLKTDKDWKHQALALLCDLREISLTFKE